jgi:MATE family multidrug resistance protein
MSGVNTLMSQSFGAKNYPRVGHILQRSVSITTCMMAPISMLWIFGTGPILRLIGIEPVTAELSQSFARVYIGYLWPMLTVQCIQCFMRSQGIVRPITAISVFSACINAPTMYFSISKFGFIGAPLGQVFAAWMLLLVYMVYFAVTGVHKRCWHGLSMEGLREWGVVLRLGAGGTMSSTLDRQAGWILSLSMD